MSGRENLNAVERHLPSGGVHIGPDRDPQHIQAGSVQVVRPRHTGSKIKNEEKQLPKPRTEMFEGSSAPNSTISCDTYSDKT